MPPVIHVVIQCRTGSSRLPGKALLPIGEYPLAVLCAKRAANTALNVCVATSDQPGDDALCRILQAHHVTFCRGPLDDVLARFLFALDQAADDDVAVRLTADNVFPDGAFIDLLVAQLCQVNYQYVSADSARSGLPYGLSAEAFRVGALRQSAAGALGPDDREHVTPRLRRAEGRAVFDPGTEIPMSHLRCTIDSLSDYLSVVELFADIADPVMVGWQDLCKRLLARHSDVLQVPQQRKCDGRGVPRMTLGTAQFGIPTYGRTRATAALSAEAVTDMIGMAAGHGVTLLDCARAYGDAESVLGHALQVLGDNRIQPISKLSPLAGLESAEPEHVSRAVEASVLRSLYELRLRSLPVLMLHRWTHRTAWNETAWRKLLDLRDEGLIKALGASVYTPAEALEALADPDILHLQLPFNVLDRRWHKAGMPEAVSGRGDVTVYARSAFLQGILLKDSEHWPIIAGVNAREVVNQLDCLVREIHRENRADLCLSYVLAHKWIDSVVVGVETVEQLGTNLEAISRAALTESECAKVEAALPSVPESLLNPAQWGLTEGERRT
jgi:spore coat polysaccharide biosynthesis protein SpsF (cytidylyltransferase family)/aryl-alcohol dehydrogenase-like predicted oxidoreductase